MSVNISFDLLKTPISVHESALIHVRLTNAGARALTIPSLMDRTDALEIVVYDLLGAVVARADGFVHQAMMVGSPRPSFARALVSIAPGETWDRTIDLGNYTYLLPSGDYEVELAYRWEAEGVDVRSPRKPLSVIDHELGSVLLLKDNCILRGLAVLLAEAPHEASRSFVRLHNHGRPLAAWYARELESHAETETTVLASNAFFQHASYDPFFERWVVSSGGGMLRATRYFKGERQGAQLAASLPGRGSTLVGAFFDGADKVFAFLVAPGGSLHCYCFEQGALQLVFVHGSAFHLGRPSSVVAEPGAIHVVTMSRELLYERLDWTGAALDARTLHKSRLQPFSCRYDVLSGSVKALYWDGPQGRTIEMVGCGVTDGVTQARVLERLAFRRDLRELAFDIDAKGDFHLLVTTTANRLYYLKNESGPWLIAASGEARYFPEVVAEKRAYLGFYQRGKGFRFVQFSSARRKGHIERFGPPDPHVSLIPSIELDADFEDGVEPEEPPSDEDPGDEPSRDDEEEAEDPTFGITTVDRDVADGFDDEGDPE